LIRQALDSGLTAVEINDRHLIPAIEEIGRCYERKEVYLPQMILAAETMQKAFHVLEPFFGENGKQSAGTVLLCTVKGDVHDIGKNIVGLFLQNQGFRVVDLGKDVPAEIIVEQASAIRADIIGLSSLMTTTMLEMPKVIKALRDHDTRIKVVVGGAVVTNQFAKDIGADGYAKDGVSAVETIRSLVCRKNSSS
jgi:5-methyltetrahydrofolate--homocysteine methyltransferase